MDTLITSYFDNFHYDFPLFHRATFQDEYESFVLHAHRAAPKRDSRANDNWNHPDHGWLVCLHMMLVFGYISCQEIPNSYRRDFQRTSVAIAISFLPVLTTKCVISNIQALLLLCFYFHNNNDRNAAWNLVGTATRMSCALGLHQSDLDSHFRPVEREIRKRVWCTLFTFEQFLCSSLGRPSGLGDPDVDVRIPKETLLDGGYGAGERFAEESLKLQYILASSRRFMGLQYQTHMSDCATARTNATPQRNGQVSSSLTAESILKDLDVWSNTLPSHLQLPNINTHSAHLGGEFATGISQEQLKLSLFRSNPRQVRSLILLHMQHQYIIMLVSRPALLVEIASSSTGAQNDGAASPEALQNGSGLSRNLAMTCVGAAVQISSLILLLNDFNLLNGNLGLDIFYAYCSAMVILLRTLWVQHTNNQAEINEESERRESLLRLVTKLRLAVGNAKKSNTSKRFADVMNKFGDVVENINNSRATPATHHMRRAREPNISATLAISPRRMNLVPQSSSDPQQAQALDRTNDAVEQSLRLPSFRNPISPHCQSQSAALPFHPTLTESAFISNSINVTPVPLNGSPLISAENESIFWHNDPLDALANGQAVDWTEFDSFLGGQLK